MLPIFCIWLVTIFLFQSILTMISSWLFSRVVRFWCLHQVREWKYFHRDVSQQSHRGLRLSFLKHAHLLFASEMFFKLLGFYYVNIDSLIEPFKAGDCPALTLTFGLYSPCKSRRCGEAGGREAAGVRRGSCGENPWPSLVFLGQVFVPGRLELLRVLFAG